MTTRNQNADSAPSHPDCQRKTDARMIALVGVMLAFIVVVGFVERQIPLSFAVPGVRLGLSNAVVLAALYLFRFRTALCIAVMKCVMLALFAGGLASLPYSACGTLLSFFVMRALLCLPKDAASPIGVSVVGAVCHIVGQYLVAAAVIEDLGLLTFLPFPAAISALTGAAVGILVKRALPVIRRFAYRS